MIHKPNKLDLKHEDAAKMNKSRRALERYKASPQYARDMAITDFFRKKWQAELAAIEAVKAGASSE